MENKSVEEIERLRVKAANIIKIGSIISVGLAIVVALSAVISGNFFSLPLAFGILIIGIIVSMVFSNKPSKEFKLAYKNTFVLQSLKSVFDDLEYNPERGFDYNVIKNTGMMYMGDRYSSNDYVKGKYKNINVEQADVHIEEQVTTTDSDGNTTTHYETLFMGQWMIFDFNKSFSANVQVCGKRFANARRSNWGKTLKYKKVEMEDAEFNKIFRVYAMDAHEAFYILTPSLMDRIKKLSNSIKGSLLLCFVDNKLHVGISNNKDAFEASLFKKLDESKIISNISSEIKLITNFVDELNLDNDLFRKEV